MTLSGTEADIINSIARLRRATKDQIRREVGFSLDYIGFLCRDLLRRGYVIFSEGHYSLAKDGIKTLLQEEAPKIDRNLLREIANEVAKDISIEFKKTIKGIKVPISFGKMKEAVKEKAEEQIKIKTDFEFPVEDETPVLKSNIEKIGVNTEKEKSDIDKSIRLFKELQSKGRKR